jgi:pimeloyl-ACP methyl ester carboxylesterase
VAQAGFDAVRHVRLGDVHLAYRDAGTGIAGAMVLRLWSWTPLLRQVLAAGGAVQDRGALTDEFLSHYIQANFSDRHRRRKTRRFLAGQIDPTNNRTTLDLLPGLRRFDHPTLLLWARDDPHFGLEWAERLSHEIRGFRRLEVITGAGHLAMVEKPGAVANSIHRFLTEDP